MKRKKGQVQGPKVITTSTTLTQPYILVTIPYSALSGEYPYVKGASSQLRNLLTILVAP